MDGTFHSQLIALLPGVFGPLAEETRRDIAGRFRPVALRSGDVLYRKGDPGDGLHVVLTGRLRVCVDEGVTTRHVERGGICGEVAAIVGGRRTATVVAVRNVLLAHLPQEAFDDLVEGHPGAGLHAARRSVERLTAEEATPAGSPDVRTIALVPLDDGVPVAELARRLQIALLWYGSVARLDRATARHRAGSDGSPSTALERILDEVESTRRFVIYEAEAGLSDWTQTCLDQADRVLFVTWADAPESPRPVEREIQDRLPRLPAGQDLVLLHPGQHATPSGTAAWLAPRAVDRHFHVAWEGRRGVSRLARFLAGRAVTLVLGGGGARGFAQIGAIRAIREAGIPIDAAGGTSIGAIVAACVALDWQDEWILQSIKQAFVDERPLNDVTVPVFALLSGDKVSEALRRWFQDVDIVDMWAPYLCVTSNLSRSRRAVHRSGPAWKAMRASVSLPGILPPFVYGGDLHVDGGILDNLPVDVVKSAFGGRTIAIDTSVQTEYTLDRDAFPSPLTHLRERLVRGALSSNVPTIASLIIKATTLGGSSSASASRRTADLYLNPPTQGFDFLDWGRIYELAELGHQYARERLPAWIEQNPDVVRRDEVLEFRSVAGPRSA